MVESEIDEYKLDTNQGKKEQTLRVSIVTDRICMLISNPKDLKDRYINLITLEQLRDVCGAFNAINTISEAASILKSAIENNLILYSEDEESGNVEIKFNITIGKKSYPPFVIPLPYDTDSDDEQNESDIQIENQNPNVIQSEKEEDIEVLPTKFDYQGNKEAEAKWGRSTKSTIDYENHIIRSGVKKPNVILEYIEPILQVHYPDGTTKSTPLPPRIQTADGKKPNIDPEQLRTIHEQMTKSFNQTLADIERENRSSSVANKNIRNNGIASNFSRQTVGALGNINVLKTENSDTINYENNSKRNNGNNNIVHSAQKPNNNFNKTVNISNIKQSKTAFNPYENNSNEQTSTANTAMPNTKVAPNDNITNFNANHFNNKGISDYSISSMPNKSLALNNFHSGTNIANPNNKNNLSSLGNSNSTSNYMTYTQNPPPIIQEVPRFLNQNMNNNMFQNMYQRGLNRSSSSPGMAALDSKANFHFYHQNQSQTQGYNFQQNQNIQNQINNINMRFPVRQANQSMILQNFQNSQNPLNNNNSIFFNQIQNPYLNKTSVYQNTNQIFNNIPQNFNINIDQSQSQFQSNNTLNRYNSSESSKSHIGLLKQNQNHQQRIFEQQRVKQQHLNQNRFQEQQRIQAQNKYQEQQRIQAQNKLQEQQRIQTQQKFQEQQRVQTQQKFQEQQRIQAQNKLQEQQRVQTQQKFQEQQRIQAQNKLQEQQRIQAQNKLQEQQRLLQISQEIKQMRNIYSQQMNQNTKKSQNSIQGITQVNFSQRNPHTNQILRSQQSQPMDRIKPQTSQNQINQPKNRSQQSYDFSYHPLKQSQSQQIMRPSPNMKNGITQQQIDLAQMASLQNLHNPNNFNASTVQLNQKFLDSAGNEETQSQYEREEIKYQDNGQQQETSIALGKQKEYEKETPLGQEQENSEETEIDNEAENLYRTETGLIIFRNGLLHGIIHKYAEIDDVVSKIQLKLRAGVKFMILYTASKDGDKAKTFHQKCNGYKMTLVLVETTKGERFGGFTTQTWDGNCIKKLDNNAFVFNLNKHRIYDIVKNEYAIGGYPKFGPVFFGCQIRIYDNFFTKGGTTCHKSLNYKTKEDYEMNNGEQCFIVKEIEVYGIEAIDV